LVACRCACECSSTGLFLTFALVALPWLAYRVDVLLPAWHFDIGWLRIAGVAIFGAFLVVYLACSRVLSTRGRGAYVEFDPPREFVATGRTAGCATRSRPAWSA